jgi:hypothetical protein
MIHDLTCTAAIITTNSCPYVNTIRPLAELKSLFSKVSIPPLFSRLFRELYYYFVST